MVDQGEELLRSLGFVEMRVHHHGDIARLEVPLQEIARVVDPTIRRRLVEGLKALGYRYVTLDLEGFRSGSLNRVLEVGGAAEGKKGPVVGNPRQETERNSGTAPLV